MEEERKESAEVSGTVENIIYSNEQNGYTVCEIDTGDPLPVTAVGIMPFLAEGEIIRLHGNWTTHATFGKQFKVEAYEKELPVTAAAILKYLSSRAVKGVGGVTARRIVDEFGDETFDVIENHPEWLADIPGISPKKAREISESFISQFGMRTVMLFFRDFFGPETVMKIYKRWGVGAVDVVKQNPYLLCEEIVGIGFNKADAFARAIGFENDSIYRIKAGICHALSHNAIQNGHVFVPSDKLIELSVNLLEIDEESAEKGLLELIEEKKAIVKEYFSKNCIYLSDYYYAEEYIVRKLKVLDRAYDKITVSEAERLINQVQREEGIVYAGLQRKAVVEAVNNGVMILTGGPGTGKTTIIRAVLRILSRLGYKIALAAPTGRAAKRMSEATQHEAKTLHRLLEAEFSGTEGSRFLRNESYLLDEDVIIVDEVSMVDTVLMSALLRAVKPGAKIMLIGDADQLPSVGAGNVLCDLIASDRFPTVRLTEIFRQASESRIVTNAHAINNGELPVLSDKKSDFFFVSREDDEMLIPTIVDLCVNRLPKTYGEDAAKGIQIITPSHKGAAGTEILNSMMQGVLNPPSKYKKEKKNRDRVFREGDKVMQVKNNYELEWKRGNEKGCGIFNGDIGIILQIDIHGECMVVSFDERICEYPFENLEELEHAYAITVHKSQGSEYPIVIIPAFRYSPRLLTRNLLYTAVTRAQSMVIIVGSAAVVQAMVENNRLTKRFTGLKFLLDDGE